MLAAIVLLSVATLVALTRQQINFNDHEHLDRAACRLALTNRQLLAEDLKVHLAEHPPGDPEHDRIVGLQEKIQRVIATTKVQCEQ